MHRPLSAFKTQQITDILKHDTSFAVCCSLFYFILRTAHCWAKRNYSPWLGYTVAVALAAVYRLLVLTMSSILRFEHPQRPTLITYTQGVWLSHDSDVTVWFPTDPPLGKNLKASCSHTCVFAATKQYMLVPVKGRWYPMAGNVIVSHASQTGSSLWGLWHTFIFC